MSTGRKVMVVIVAVFAVALLWVMAATIRLSNMKMVDGDGKPDKVVSIPLAAFATEHLGITSGTPVPLSKQFTSEPSGKLELAFGKVYRDAGNKELVATIAARVGDAKGLANYSEGALKWATGTTPSVTFAFTDGDVRLLCLGRGYGIGRFFTFRGPESCTYTMEFGSNRVENDTLSEILAKASSVTITLPDTPEWQRLKTPK